MPWLRVGTTADFPPATRRFLRLLGRPVLVRRDADGNCSALELGCRHQGADLSAGTIAGDQVTCRRHGWRYDLATGACLDHPELPLRPLPCRLDGDRLLVDPRPAEK